MALCWEEWGAAAFARARGEGRPVLLSLTARVVPRLPPDGRGDVGRSRAWRRRWPRAAVPVRVDADARPDVYGRYHLGGLPTTALLNAEGASFAAPRFSRGPALRLPRRGGRRPARRAAPRAAPAARAPCRRARRRPRRRRRGRPWPGTTDRRAARPPRRREHGGFGWAPKLPEPEAVTLLLRRHGGGATRRSRRMVRAALDAIAATPGGSRATAASSATRRRPTGRGPHTEKVTVDQAALIRLFLEAAVALGERAI